tara:strand:+ start:264 stop:602 length:339 start_codon:yes stop_codon:yes gene_type:complete
MIAYKFDFEDNKVKKYNMYEVPAPKGAGYEFGVVTQWGSYKKYNPNMRMQWKFDHWFAFKTKEEAEKYGLSILRHSVRREEKYLKDLYKKSQNVNALTRKIIQYNKFKSKLK